MKSLDELQHDLQSIYNELEKIKVAQLSDKDRTMNFKELSSRAERHPIANHPMSAKDEYFKQVYLLMLLSVAHLDDSAYEDSLLTTYRIAHGMHFEGEVDRVFLFAKQMNFDKLDECTRLFINDDLKLILLLDCMLVTAKFDKGKRKAMEYIADLCSLLLVTKEQVIFLGNLARAILTQDVTQYHCNIPNIYGSLFDCYIDDIAQVEDIAITLTKEILTDSFACNVLTGIEVINNNNNNKSLILKAEYTMSMGFPSYENINVDLRNGYEYVLPRNKISRDDIAKSIGFFLKTNTSKERIENFKGSYLAVGVGYNGILSQRKAFRLLERIENNETDT